MRFKLTGQEKKWILYDVGNSAFILLVATIIPIQFNSLAQGAGVSSAEYVAYWGYAISAATFTVALLGPFLGAVSDRRGRKKPLFLASVLLGALFCLLLGFVRGWVLFLVVFSAAKIAHSVSLIFYDSMLVDIAEKDRMDSVSSQGYAWGYIGSCAPFLICMALILGADFIGMSMRLAVGLSFLTASLWWIGCTVPLLRVYRQKHCAKEAKRQNDFIRIFKTIKEILNDKQIFLFILAFFFYIDGVYTIIDMATAYGTALGFDTKGLLSALLVTQAVAFPFSAFAGMLSRKYKSSNLITISIIAYFGISVFAVFMSTQLHFWILAIAVGIFQGGIQALSRSHFAKIIPFEKSGEYFGLLDICSKGASLLGTLTVSAVSQITDSINFGVGAIAIFFAVGFVLFRCSVRVRKQQIKRTY